MVTPVQRRKLRLREPIPSPRALGNRRLRFSALHLRFPCKFKAMSFLKRSKHPIDSSGCVMSSYRRQGHSFCQRSCVSSSLGPAALSSVPLNKHSEAGANISKHLLCARQGLRALYTLHHSLSCHTRFMGVETGSES